MYVYHGKFNWFESASYESFTLVFPAGFALNDPVSAHWQWSVDPSCGKEKVNTSHFGIITAVFKIAERQYRLTIPFDVYAFEFTITSNFRLAKLSNPQPGLSANLSLRYANYIHGVPTTVVYTGKLNYGKFAKDEMITLVLPAGIEENAPAGLYYQWTLDAGDTPKRAQIDLGKLSGIQKARDGIVTARLQHWYKYHFAFSADKNSAVAIMAASDGLDPHMITFERAPCVESPVGGKRNSALAIMAASDRMARHGMIPLPGVESSPAVVGDEKNSALAIMSASGDGMGCYGIPLPAVKSPAGDEKRWLVVFDPGADNGIFSMPKETDMLIEYYLEYEDAVKK